MIAGSYDDGDTRRHSVVRYKASRVAALRYLLEVRRAKPETAQASEGCEAGCQACTALREETGAKDAYFG